MFLTEEVKVMVDSIQVAINNSLIDGFWDAGNVNCKLKAIVRDICCQISGVPLDWFEDVDFDFYEYGLSKRLDAIIGNVCKEYADYLEFLQLQELCNQVNVYFPFSRMDVDNKGNKVIKFDYNGDVISLKPNEVESFLLKYGKEPPF